MGTLVTPKQRMLNAYRGVFSDRYPVAPEFWTYIPAKVMGVDISTFEREVPLWQALHATFKQYDTDGWACIGSSNFNRRSLQHDLEVDYTLQLSESVNQLQHDFLDDIKQSEELCQYELSVKKPWQRYLGGLILVLFSYWL